MITRKRIRIDYAPLSVAVSVECTTPGSPATQVYNPDTGEYDPDRELTATALRPSVIADAKDGSWKMREANSLLASMQWYVDGVAISSHPDWTGTTADGRALYEIDSTQTSSRGTLTIRKNVAPGKQYSLQFKGVVSDKRLGTNLPITTDPVILSTEDKSEDAYSLSVGESQIIKYNPFTDMLLDYNYREAHDAATADESEADYTDANAYKRVIGVTLYKGGVKVEDGYSLKLYRVEAANTRAELKAGEGEVVSITSTSIELDLRLVEKCDYIIEAVVEGTKRVAPATQFSVDRLYPAYTCTPTNGAGINPDDKIRKDSVMASCGGNVLYYPENIIKIVWHTETAALDKTHNEGDTTEFVIADTGIGSDYDDDWMEVYVETEQKEAYSVASEGSDTFINENGENLIFN